MNNFLAAIIIVATYSYWGYWLLSRRDNQDDINSGFLWSIIPVALCTWFALYLIRPDFPF